MIFSFVSAVIAREYLQWFVKPGERVDSAVSAAELGELFERVSVESNTRLTSGVAEIRFEGDLNGINRVYKLLEEKLYSLVAVITASDESGTRYLTENQHFPVDSGVSTELLTVNPNNDKEYRPINTVDLTNRVSSSSYPITHEHVTAVNNTEEQTGESNESLNYSNGHSNHHEATSSVGVTEEKRCDNGNTSKLDQPRVTVGTQWSEDDTDQNNKAVPLSKKTFNSVASQYSDEDCAVHAITADKPRFRGMANTFTDLKLKRQRVTRHRMTSDLSDISDAEFQDPGELGTEPKEEPDSDYVPRSGRNCINPSTRTSLKISSKITHNNALAVQRRKRTRPKKFWAGMYMEVDSDAPEHPSGRGERESDVEAKHKELKTVDRKIHYSEKRKRGRRKKHPVGQAGSAPKLKVLKLKKDPTSSDFLPVEISDPSPEEHKAMAGLPSAIIPKRGRGRPKKYPNGPPTEFPCIECDFKAMSRKRLYNHCARKHVLGFKTPHKCDICDKVFGMKSDLSRHMFRHRGIKTHMCDICGKLYKHLKSLEGHKMTHDDDYTKPQIPCDKCGKIFTTFYVLKNHIKSEHFGIKKSFLCQHCGKTFTSKLAQQQHQNVHLGIKPFVCDKCGKAFTYEKSLQDHQSVHDNKRPHTCMVCFKSFKLRNALKFHERIHMTGRDFHCDKCGKGFTQKQALIRHERVHIGVKPFSCRLCGRNFRDMSIIRRHMILIHKGKYNKWQDGVVENKIDSSRRLESVDEADIEVFKEKYGGPPKEPRPRIRSPRVGKTKTADQIPLITHYSQQDTVQLRRSNLDLISEAIAYSQPEEYMANVQNTYNMSFKDGKPVMTTAPAQHNATTLVPLETALGAWHQPADQRTEHESTATMFVTSQEMPYAHSLPQHQQEQHHQQQHVHLQQQQQQQQHHLSQQQRPLSQHSVTAESDRSADSTPVHSTPISAASMDENAVSSAVNSILQQVPLPFHYFYQPVIEGGQFLGGITTAHQAQHQAPSTVASNQSAAAAAVAHAVQSHLLPAHTHLPNIPNTSHIQIPASHQTDGNIQHYYHQ